MLLTIAIPTYRREKELLELIRDLVRAIIKSNLQDEIRILISDNDPVSLLENQLREFMDIISYTKNDQNIGAGLNLVKCFDLSDSKFVWLLSDDDYPNLSIFDDIIFLLRNKCPSLVYLKPKFHLPGSRKLTYGQIKFHCSNAKNILITANSRITFLSSFIINKQKYLSLSTNKKHSILNSRFPHLEYILTLLKHKENFYISNKQTIYASGGNSGGYDVLRTFGIELINIIDIKFGSHSWESRFLKRCILIFYIPALCNALSSGTLGSFKFDQDYYDKALEEVYKNNKALFFLSIMQFQKNAFIRFLARVSYQSLKIVFLFISKFRFNEILK